MINQNKSKKIFSLFALLVLGFLIFLGVMLTTALKERHIPSLYTSDTIKAKRGSIISADGFHIAATQKLYKAVVDTRSIDPKKQGLFIKLFSIYSGISTEEIKKRLRSLKGSVVLSYHIGPKEAQHLKALAFELRKLGVFIEFIDQSGHEHLHGLSIIESGEARQYPYADLLTPVVGYPGKVDEEDGYTISKGIKGLEKYYDDELSARQNGKQSAPRDVNNYLILNKKSFKRRAIDGLSVKISIPVTLQIKIERLLDTYKSDLDAHEIMAIVMRSDNGEILSFVSSNRFHPTEIRRKDYPSLNANAIEYSFEPGSVLKPIIFALLLDLKKINPYDLVFAYNGRYKLGRKVITDEHKFDWLSAENVIVHSSNIGIAQLAQKLDAVDYYQGLKDFGLTKRSGIDLPYERAGSMPSISELRSKIYKATTSYGYGIRVNLIQLLKAYNAFNNSGRIMAPYITTALIDESGREIEVESSQPAQVISPSTAAHMKQILIKTVNKGTGMEARTPGLEIGGKTGTAHLVERGRYVNKYNSSFLGFANDAQGNKYTIAVTAVRPKSQYYASSTAVPIFKAIVDTMVEEGYLTPNETVPIPQDDP